MYPQPALSGAQPTVSGIPLAMVGSGPMSSQNVLIPGGEGTVSQGMVKLPGGETIAFVAPVMMEPGCSQPIGYPTMVPVNMDKDVMAAASLRAVGMDENGVWAPADSSMSSLQPSGPPSCTSSLKDSEEQGEAKQTRIARFQVTKVVEEAVRRGVWLKHYV